MFQPLHLSYPFTDSGLIQFGKEINKVVLAHMLEVHGLGEQQFLAELVRLREETYQKAQAMTREANERINELR